jgi:hypothetical protein
MSSTEEVKRIEWERRCIDEFNMLGSGKKVLTKNALVLLIMIMNVMMPREKRH